MWRAFAARSPTTIARLAGRSSIPALDLTPIVRLYSDTLPQYRARQLYISRIDEAVLEPFSTDAGIPVARAVGRVVSQPSWPHGDGFVFDRILAWMSTRAELFERLSNRGDPFRKAIYRLTSTGHAVLTRGLDRVSDAPPCWIGGYLA